MLEAGPAPIRSGRQQRQIKRLLAVRRILSRLPIKGKRTLSTYLTRALAPDVHLVVAKVGGCTRTLDITDRVQRWMFFELYDQDETSLLAKLLKPGDCFLDIGANVGWYTLAAAPIVTSAGQVHSFEPVPANARLLRQTLETNHLNWVHLAEAAVSDTPGSLDLHLPESGGESGWATAAPSAGGKVISVPCVTIDSYLEAAGSPVVHAAKIDVEGFEPAVLRGMARTLEQHRPSLLIELNRPMLAKAGFSEGDIADVLGPLGYCFREVGRGARLSPFVFGQSCAAEFTNLLATAPNAEI